MIERNENENDLKNDKNKKQNSFNNSNNNSQNSILNRPFKDADNDDETNEEYYLSSHEKENKRNAKRKIFIKNKKLLSGLIPKFNLNASKVKKNEKVKEENIHKIGTKINKEVFDIVYKSEKEEKNKIITINLCNKDLCKLIINIFIYNIHFLFIGIFVGFFNLNENLIMFIAFIVIIVFKIIYEKNNIMYNNDLFKNEPIIQSVIFIIIDLIFPAGIILGNQLINLYYKNNLIKYYYLLIFINGICSGTLLFCGLFLFYFEETKNSADIKNKFIYFSVGIMISFIIISLNYKI